MPGSKGKFKHEAQGEGERVSHGSSIGPQPLGDGRVLAHISKPDISPSESNGLGVFERIGIHIRLARQYKPNLRANLAATPGSSQKPSAIPADQYSVRARRTPRISWKLCAKPKREEAHSGSPP